MNTEEAKPSLFGRIARYYAEVRAEIKKVTWPTRGDLYGKTIVIFAVTALLSLFLWLVDTGIFQVLKVLLKI